jgi:hypothetical protein
VALVQRLFEEIGWARVGDGTDLRSLMSLSPGQLGDNKDTESCSVAVRPHL